MIEKWIGKIYAWSIKRAKKRITKKKKTEIELKREQFYIQLQSLYNFVLWLNTKGLKNRKEKKSFWKNVVDNQQLLPDVVKQLVDRYAPPKTEEQKVTTYPSKVENN